jgi:hypothetical protein
MKKLNEIERRVVDAFSNLVRVDAFAYSNTRFPPLNYEGLIKAVANTLKLTPENTKSILHSATEKNPSEFAKYFSKHSS